MPVVDAQCRPFRAIMRDLGHDRIDLPKLDIEGAEHEASASMLGDGILPCIVAVEFDRPAPCRKRRGTFKKVLSAGYAFVYMDGNSLTFVQRALLG